MPVETLIDRARTRVRTEREAIDEKREAFEAFIDRVSTLSPEPASPTSSKLAATAGGHLADEARPDDRCRTVRTAIDELIRPHSVADTDEPEPLLATIRTEFTDAIAVALAPTTETTFSAELKRALLSEADARRAETETMDRALAREDAHLEDAEASVAELTAWLVDADETPLTDLGFEALKRRHETLATYRDRCAELARERQAFLRERTNRDVRAGIHHQRLVPYLYQDFPVDHPVLATAVRLDGVCAECQRTVREHLIRRA
ncbi:MAG: hypothetical protein ABEI80_08710 [Haloplanus sp.]